MRHLIENLNGDYKYEETVLGYFALFYKDTWLGTYELLWECINTAAEHFHNEQKD